MKNKYNREISISLIGAFIINIINNLFFSEFNIKLFTLTFLVTLIISVPKIIIRKFDNVIYIFLISITTISMIWINNNKLTDKKVNLIIDELSKYNIELKNITDEIYITNLTINNYENENVAINQAAAKMEQLKPRKLEINNKIKKLSNKINILNSERKKYIELLFESILSDYLLYFIIVFLTQTSKKSINN